MTKQLLVSMYQAINVSRTMRQGGYKLQRIKRGKWLIQDSNGQMIMPMRITTEVQPDNQLYYEELS